jgi:hypothetical protein
MNKRPESRSRTSSIRLSTTSTFFIFDM